MERVPAWLFVVGAVVFGALAIWSATDENWAGLIAGVALAGLCFAGFLRKRSDTSI